MALWKEIRNRLAYLLRRSRFDRELEDEIELHIRARADELEQAGLTGGDALLQARREFGSTLRTREETRSAWQMRWLEDLGSDLRHAARALRRDRALALVAAGSLALGIGANTTIFSFAKEALFSEPSCRDPRSLVQISVSGNVWVPMAQVRYLEQTGVFDGVAGMNIGMVVNWRQGDRSYRLAGTHVTDNFFEVTGIPVAMGRPIARGEAGVAVVTHGFWKRRLGGDPNVLGRKLVLDGDPYTVIGVLPRDHRMLAGFGFTPDLYLTKDPGEVLLYARLPDGLSRQAAYGRLKPIFRELDRVYPDVNRKWSEGTRISAAGGADRLRSEGGVAMPVVAFFGMLVIVTGIVVLIACANVSSLLLARAFSREREFAIRMSLGAGRGRLVRQLLAESLLLALLGTGAGLLLNLWLTRLLSGFRIPTPLPIELVIQPDRLLLAYAVGISFLVTLATGLAPALRGTRGIGNALKEGAVLSGGSRWTLRNALVVGQLAVSIVLLSAGLLFIRNMLEAASFSSGFDTTHTLVATFQPVRGSYTPERFGALVDSALQRLRDLPGVEAAAPAWAVPLNPFLAFNGGRESGELRLGGGNRTARVQYNFNAVGPDYFRTLAIPILKGRAFLDSDRAEAPPVVILNETMARRLFGDGNPIGRVIGFPKKGDARVVGVARNSRYVTLGEGDALAIYVPFAQKRPALAHFFVRTRSGPESMLRQVDKALGQLDAGASVETATTRDLLSAALLPSRAGAGVTGVTAAFGLILASVGLYGVLLYAVNRRVREIGIRVALGATPGGVFAMVAGESARLLAAGMAVGLAVAAVAVRPLSMFLVPEVRAADPVNFVMVGCVLSLVAVLATVAPTARALRVDPAVALRHE